MTSGFSPDDARYMARALRLAERGLYTTDPNPRVGCVLVRHDRIVGEGWHCQAGGAHAEIEALRAAGGSAKGATVYVTLEPCCHFGRTPPCCDALIQAGVARVIAAMRDPNPQVAGRGLRALAEAGVEAAGGLLEGDARALNMGFCKRMVTGVPWVSSKLAMSLDGRTAMASGESQWITGSFSRQDVHRLRARSSAIVTGVGTVLADDPALTARLQARGREVKQPLRVIMDTNLRTPPHARMARLAGGSLILTASTDPAKAERLEEAGFEVVTVARGDDGRIDLQAALEYLGRREINEVLVEAGRTLNGTLLSNGLIDELVVYLAPSILGDDARGLFHLPAVRQLSQRIPLDLVETRRVGGDLRLRFRRKNPGEVRSGAVDD